MDKEGLLCVGDEVKSRLLAEIPLDSRFHVEPKPFARGKFAAVRRALMKEDDSSIYAAKYIRKRRRASPEEVWHEVCVLDLSRECPFIVHLFQVFETQLDTILMLEMAEGGDLQTVLDTDEFIKETVCIDILKDTLKGLLFLHQHSIAHLDVKPQNLVLTGPLPGGRVKLCDFGLSRCLSKSTEVRELFGTPEYVSPEVLNYEPITLAVDCWAVGVLTYVLLSGLSPFAGDTKQETYLNISQRALTFPQPYFTNVSPLAVDFIEKLLIIKPSERLTVIESLRHIWLDKINQSYSTPSSPAEPNNNHKGETEREEPPPEGTTKGGSSEDDKGFGHFNLSSSTNGDGDKQGPNDEIDSGIGSEDGLEENRRNLSWARLDEVLENERKTSTNPDWLTLEVLDEDALRNIWPNRKMKCSWEAECTGAVLRALDQLERRRGGVTPQANLLRAYGGRSQVLAKEKVGGRVVIREFRRLPSAPALLTKHSELTCDTISTRINKLFN